MSSFYQIYIEIILLLPLHNYIFLLCHLDILRKQLKLSHPENSDLAFLYGTIVTDDDSDVGWNCCVFAEREVYRNRN